MHVKYKRWLMQIRRINEQQLTLAQEAHNHEQIKASRRIILALKKLENALKKAWIFNMDFIGLTQQVQADLNGIVLAPNIQALLDEMRDDANNLNNYYLRRRQANIIPLVTIENTMLIGLRLPFRSINQGLLDVLSYYGLRKVFLMSNSDLRIDDMLQRLKVAAGISYHEMLEKIGTDKDSRLDVLGLLSPLEQSYYQEYYVRQPGLRLMTDTSPLGCLWRQQYALLQAHAHTMRQSMTLVYEPTKLSQAEERWIAQRARQPQPKHPKAATYAWLRENIPTGTILLIDSDAVALEAVKAEHNEGVQPLICLDCTRPAQGIAAQERRVQKSKEQLKISLGHQLHDMIRQQFEAGNHAVVLDILSRNTGHMMHHIQERFHTMMDYAKASYEALLRSPGGIETVVDIMRTNNCERFLDDDYLQNFYKDMLCDTVAACQDQAMLKQVIELLEPITYRALKLCRELFTPPPLAVAARLNKSNNPFWMKNFERSASILSRLMTEFYDYLSDKDGVFTAAVNRVGYAFNQHFDATYQLLSRLQTDLSLFKKTCHRSHRATVEGLHECIHELFSHFSVMDSKRLQLPLQEVPRGMVNG